MYLNPFAFLPADGTGLGPKLTSLLYSENSAAPETNYTLKPELMIAWVRQFLNLSRLRLTVAFAGKVAPKSLLWAIDMVARGAAGKGRSVYILKLANEIRR